MEMLAITAGTAFGIIFIIAAIFLLCMPFYYIKRAQEDWRNGDKLDGAFKAAFGTLIGAAVYPGALLLLGSIFSNNNLPLF